MTQYVATAPGKLIVAGEYAALQGGAAIAVGAGRRAAVQLNTNVEQSELCIANDGNVYGFELIDSGVCWQRNPGALGSLFEAVTAVLSNSGTDLRNVAPFSLRLCTREFYSVQAGQATKLGLGSSAALAVALSGCLQQAAGKQVDVTAALAAHRKFQDGQGSGIDVHTSYHGGTIALAAGNRLDDNGANRLVSSLNWPPQLHVLPVWTGKAASTPAMLQQLHEFATTYPERHTELLTELSKRSADAVRACESADASALIHALQVFTSELRAFDDITRLGIWSEEHLRLAQLADQARVLYKPSGAGGGDFGLAFATDLSSLTAFQTQATRAGFDIAEDLELGVGGLEIIKTD